MRHLPGHLPPWNRPERLVWIRRRLEYVRLHTDGSVPDVEGCARPGPILRTSDQRRLDGICVDVFQFIPEISCTAQNEIKVTFLPDCAVLRSRFGDRETGCTFPVTHQLWQQRLQSPEQKVDVIRHHDIGKQCKLMLGTRAVDLVKASIAFWQRERWRVFQEICSNEEIASGNFNSSEA